MFKMFRCSGFSCPYLHFHKFLTPLLFRVFAFNQGFLGDGESDECQDSRFTISILSMSNVSAFALLNIYPAPSSHPPLPPLPRSVPWARLAAVFRAEIQPQPCNAPPSPQSET